MENLNRYVLVTIEGETRIVLWAQMDKWKLPPKGVQDLEMICPDRREVVVLNAPTEVTVVDFRLKE